MSFFENISSSSVSSLKNLMFSSKIISPPLDSRLYQKYWWLIIPIIVVITFIIYINVKSEVGVSYECAELGECGDVDYDSINPNDR